MFFKARGPGWPRVGAVDPVVGVAEVVAWGVALPDVVDAAAAAAWFGAPAVPDLPEGKLATGAAVIAGAPRIGLVARPEERVGRDDGNDSGWVGGISRFSGIEKEGGAVKALELVAIAEDGGIEPECCKGSC